MSISTANITADFLTFMHEVGLDCQDPITPDGKIHRFHIPGDAPGTKNGWYVLYEDEIPAGAFGSWKLGITHKWSAKNPNTLSPQERSRLEEQMKQAQTVRDQELQRLRGEAAEEVTRIWERGADAHPDFPYLRNKGIQPLGLKVDQNKLLVPLRNSDGHIETLQFIDGNGKKQFFTGGKVTGNYWTIGVLNDPILIGEGVATMATLHEATGCGVVVAFNAGNLESVAKVIRQQHQRATVILCADDDFTTEGNPGVTKAKASAKRIQGKVAIPKFKHKDGKNTTDFNDLSQREGLEVVKAQIQEVMNQQSSHDLAGCVLPYSTLLTRNIPPRKRYLPWLPEGGMGMIYGKRGVGKTFFSLGLMASLVTGKPFLPWPVTEPVEVLYVDGEMSLDELRTRFTVLLPQPPKTEPYFLTGEEVYARSKRDLTLTEEKDREQIIRILDQYPAIKVVIFDNVSCLFTRLREDKKDDWEPINAWLLRLRHRGVTSVLVHHSGKTGTEQRGTSGREDALDFVIRLQHPPDYDAKEGCRFTLDFTKSRSMKGEEVKSIEVAIRETDGQLDLTYQCLEETNLTRAENYLAAGGNNARDLAEILDVNRSTGHRLLKKAKEKAMEAAKAS